MTGVPSSMSNVAEDIHVCEVSNSLPDASPIVPLVTDLPVDQANQLQDIPFEFLPGEQSIQVERDLVDDVIYLTSYRLFTFCNQASHCSFINCPLRLIESIEVTNNYLLIQCKDIRSFRLVFFTSEKCSSWLKKLNESIALPTNFDDIFAIKYATSHTKENSPSLKHDYARRDMQRLHLHTAPWRTTEINHDHKLCPSYPPISVVPAAMTDEDIHVVAKFRSNRRFPSIVWRHRNGAVIARASQPEVGWLCWRSKEDEKMIQAIIDACACSAPTAKYTQPSETTANRLLILDARSYTAALANRTKGGGFEYPPYYADCDVKFMNLPNIHAIRKSAQMLRAAIANAAQGETWLSQLESTRWLHNLSALINVASFVVSAVDKQAQPVLVHCSDGWDRTPQITALAELMLDPYYRTIDGFQVLVQREWIAHGHKFADRCGHGVGTTDPNERSPVFLQWLDCIYQLFLQNRTAFEFNEMFLLKVANHTYTCLHGTFLCNNDAERATMELESRTISLWSFLHRKSQDFINHLYDDTKKHVLCPSSSVRDLSIWSNLYMRDICQTPAGSAEHTSTLIPARIRSYEDLSNSMTNGLHRSTSDSILSTSTPVDGTPSTSIAHTLRMANPSPCMSQSPSTRLHSSTSNNSLFGPPHHLGTCNDSTHNFTTQSPAQQSLHRTSFPNNHSPESRMKQQDFIIDDSAPDITQLAISFHQYPLNVNGVDHILRTMARSRKLTTSTSSTASSLSEAWSLTRINPADQSQTLRKMQHLTANQIIKLVRKRIDIDGLTKIPDQTTERMARKDRSYVQHIDRLNEHIRYMQRFIYTLINIKQNQQFSPRMDSISQSNLDSPGTSSCSSWQKIDNSDPTVARWVPDFNGHQCFSCNAKFQLFSIVRRHHCRKCGNVFCGTCANYYRSIPSVNLSHAVRVCRNCFAITDDHNSSHHHAAMESPRTSALPMPIQSGCRQAGVPSNGSFPSAGGQKVKG